MANVNVAYAASTSLTFTGLSTLASATYLASSVIDNTTTKYLDYWVEVTVATTNAPAGNKQLLVFAVASYDGTNYQTGPVSGTTTTDEPLLTYLGTIQLATTSVTERRGFSVATAYGGNLPPYIKVVAKNDLGVALTTGTALMLGVNATVV